MYKNGAIFCLTLYVQRSQVHYNFWTSQVVWSRLKSTVKSSRVGFAQVAHCQLGVILASSQVKFLYLSDSQV